MDYIAPSHKEKLVFGNSIAKKVYQWCQEQERQYHDQLQGLVTITVKQQMIQTCPLNHELAEYTQNSKVKQSVGLLLTHKTEKVTPSTWPASLLTYQTREVLDGISERQGYYDTAIMLSIKASNLLMPVCAMVVAVIPASFGLYLLQYSCSTYLDHMQQELWDPASFSVRTLHAISFTDKDGTQTIQELKDLYPQLVSLFAESCSVRRAYLNGIGISGGSLL